ncbi:hypothetical protein BXY66_0217 [Shimia isoporae]|uniref:Secreted protein n=1 Tax=Shimia isoporae TaxID=647720 RepID=A0A4R1NJ55_9RHOB|nr:hypothetical protein [Shimia isoporae]TCL08184.1 hypothetical protein BXY66_0217 [Shimia isoporae]
MNRVLALLTFLTSAAPVFAEAPEVTDARASKSGDTWRFDVTLLHPDTGWDHYADGWRVELNDGTVLTTRVLTHPHVNEQPFTRSQSGVKIPEGTQTVYIRSRCIVDGWSDGVFALELE